MACSAFFFPSVCPPLSSSFWSVITEPENSVLFHSLLPPGFVVNNSLLPVKTKLLRRMRLLVWTSGVNFNSIGLDLMSLVSSSWASLSLFFLPPWLFTLPPKEVTRTVSANHSQKDCTDITLASLIAMLVIGGILFICWGIWDGFFAPYPFMPKRVFNRTFVSVISSPLLSINQRLSACLSYRRLLLLLLFLPCRWLLFFLGIRHCWLECECLLGVWYEV